MSFWFFSLYNSIYILQSIVYSHDRKEDGDRNLQPEALILELDFSIINLWEERKQQENIKSIIFFLKKEKELKESWAHWPTHLGMSGW
jgi:hypothetical protein